MTNPWIEEKIKLIDKKWRLYTADKYDSSFTTCNEEVKEFLRQSLLQATEMGRVEALNSIRKEIWRLDEIYHKPHDELKTPCSEGSESLNELEAFVLLAFSTPLKEGNV